MATDARNRWKTFLDTYLRPAQIVDDNSNQAGFEVMYENPNYPVWKELKAPSTIDVIYTVGVPESRPMMDPVTQAPYGYDEHSPLKIYAVDKTDVTGITMINTAERELRYILETYPTGSLRSAGGMSPNTRVLGSTILYSREYDGAYRRDTST